MTYLPLVTYLGVTILIIVALFVKSKIAAHRDEHSRTFCRKGGKHEMVQEQTCGEWISYKCQKCDYSWGHYMAGGFNEAANDLNAFVGLLFGFVIFVLWIYGLTFVLSFL